ncbi:MAG: hypothetical protein AAF501_16750 [Pseudomonadota bacterium]
MADWKSAPKAKVPDPESVPDPVPEPPAADTFALSEVEFDIQLPAFIDRIMAFDLMGEISALVGFEVPPVALLAVIFVLAIGLLLFGLWEREPKQKEIDKYRPDAEDRLH